MKQKKQRTLAIFALTVAIVATTVAYAVLQTTLNISGTVVKKGGTWNIYFTNPSSASVTGTAKGSNITLQATNLNFSVELYKPTDSVTYTVDIKNGGTIDAVLDSVSLTGVDTAKSNDVTYNVTYSDGSAITKGNTLNIDETKTIKISVKYDDVSSISATDIKLNVGLTLIYVQTSGSSTSGGTGGSGSTIYTDSVLVGNDPNLLNNSLTPVVYDGTNWVVADTTKKWYDYSNQEWANAVILNSGVTKNVGDIVTVPTDTSTETDVKAMYVWIPRYEYHIEGTYGTHLDGTAGTQGLPGQIEVRFIPRSQTSADGNYILHPAFTWDNDSNGTIIASEHITGIWVGKFETTGDSSTPTILPNISSLRNQTVSAQFTTAQKFATYLTNSSNTDSHMMKNSEWGAVAYLSQSIYGKYGNTLYTGANKEVYKNDSSGFYTGRSSGKPSASGSSSTGTCLYNDITDRGDGTGSCGAGASTTGNITGVYDMSGGAWESIMGYLTTASSTWGAASSGNNAGFTSAPDSKYYDSYTSTTATTACNGGICYGHALSETSGWYSDIANFVHANFPWFIRGGYYNGSTTAGVFGLGFSNGGADNSNASRGVLLAEGA